MKRKQIIAGLLGFALLLSLCACTQPPVWDSSHEIRKDAENAAWIFGFWAGTI